MRANQETVVTEIEGKDIVDLILLDHKYLKECIHDMTEEGAEKRKKLSMAKSFLDALGKHSEAEKKTLYVELQNMDEFRSMILEGYIEHGVVDKKVKMLKSRLLHARSLSDENQAELKVLAEMLEHHIKEEESEMLPKAKDLIDSDSLMEMGAAFAKKRKFTEKDLEVFPDFQKELQIWKDSVSQYSHQFVKKLDQYVESLKH